MIGDALYKKREDGILQHYIFQSEVHIILDSYHLSILSMIKLLIKL